MYTYSLLPEIEGRSLPLKLATAGKVFRPGKLDDRKIRLNMFYQLDFLYIAEKLTLNDMKNEVIRLFKEIVPDCEIKFNDENYNWFDNSLGISLKFGNNWINVAGCGQIEKKLLKKLKVDPDIYSSISVGIGLDRLAMILNGIDDIREVHK